MTEIGKEIYAARSRKGYTQAKLAEKIGVTQAQISQWENNRSAPSPKHKLKLEKVLGLSEDMAKLGDMAKQIRELVEQCPVSVPDIAKKAKTSLATIYNILNGKVTSPGKGPWTRLRKH